MLVNHEIKSQLAKLLATEDLIVENKNVETAAFNTHTRVLTLPTWDRASNNIYDSLVAHEVGHALYTPNTEWWKEVKINKRIKFKLLYDKNRGLQKKIKIIKQI